MDEALAPASPVHTSDLAQAYAELTFGILVTDALGFVVFANQSAEDFFAPLRPISFAVRALLGLSGFTGGGSLAQAAETNAICPPIRVGLPDGRILEARSKPLHGGGSTISLSDVTSYVRNAELADLDALTGLTTRAGLQKRLGELLAEGRRSNSSVAVLYIDLDKFKTVNDTLGHPVGDALLVKVADRLRNVARATDVVARLGGDEFVIVQTDVAQPQAAEALATRLVDLIGRTYIAAGHMLTIGASIGVAMSPDDGHDVAILVKRADLALYQARLRDADVSASSRVAWIRKCSPAACLKWTCAKRWR